MNFSGIKHKILSKKIDGFIKKNNNTALHVLKPIKTIGIIVNENSKFDFEHLKKLQKQIPIGSNNFSILTYKNKNESYNEFRGAFFYEKQVAFNGKIKSDEVNNFLDQQFDMLIDYTGANTIYSEFLVAKSQAKFKVGHLVDKKNLYNFMISVPLDDIERFNKELIQYLKILKKIE
ncbi:MAG TPA: hypothetical protein ENK67_00055 [Flavobacteriia bacterium]|nr:hypothetical protein [Flavobacteriia bacterium]